MGGDLSWEKVLCDCVRNKVKNSNSIFGRKKRKRKKRHPGIISKGNLEEVS
jgi:hypothetical protein